MKFRNSCCGPGGGSYLRNWTNLPITNLICSFCATEIQFHTLFLETWREKWSPSCGDGYKTANTVANFGFNNL